MALYDGPNKDFDQDALTRLGRVCFHLTCRRTALYSAIQSLLREGYSYSSPEVVALSSENDAIIDASRELYSHIKTITGCKPSQGLAGLLEERERRRHDAFMATGAF